MTGGGRRSKSWRPEPISPLTTSKPKDKGDVVGETLNDPCVIEEVTNLNSVVATVLGNIRAGDRLDIVVLPGPPQRLVAIESNGHTVGSITSRSMLQIIQCIQNGRQYIANVLLIRGGICQVKVRMK